MKSPIAFLVLASTVCLPHFAFAQAEEPAADTAPTEVAPPEAAKGTQTSAEPEPAAEAPEPASEAPEPLAKPEPAGKREPSTESERVGEAEAPPENSFQFYAMVVPFVEYVDIGGATSPDTMEADDHMIGNAYSGIEGQPRMRMTAGTSHFGFRGGLTLAPQLKVIAQFETALAVDGNPNPWAADIPNRDTYAGFSGDVWGTLVAGLLDTPYKWSTLTTINPIRAGYVADFLPIMHTPGFGATALNATQGPQSNQQSNAAFFRREGNSIQYWSPKVLTDLTGLTLRLGYVMNENRASGQEALSPSTNPYIVSGAASFDMWGLRLRYAFELHNDFFGIGASGVPTGPTFEIPKSKDTGHAGLVQYTLAISPDIKTRVAGVYEILSYKDDTDIVGQVDEYSRPAYYGILHQQLHAHHVWGAYGQAGAGECHRVGETCSTGGLGATLIEAGYMYAVSPNFNVHVIGYRLANNRAANYVTSPALPRTALAPGADTTGVGVGFYYAFDADLLN